MEASKVKPILNDKKICGVMHKIGEIFNKAELENAEKIFILSMLKVNLYHELYFGKPTPPKENKKL